MKINAKLILIITLYSAAFAMLLTGFREIKAKETINQLENLRFAVASATQTPLINIFPMKQRNYPDDTYTTDNNYTLPASCHDNNTKNSTLQKKIAKQVIRFHVIANSDSQKDQSLKLMVRNEVISSLQNALRNADSAKQAEEIIMARIPDITNSALRVLTQQGCNDSVSVKLTNREFPVKKYGDFTFPAGNYRALCIEIGQAKGHNWWCVLFPSLCFVDETTATVPDTSKEKLKEHLTEEEYHALLDDSTPDVDATSSPASTEKPKIRFALLDWLK